MACTGWAVAYRAMPSTASATATQVRGAMRSRNSSQLSTATATGIADMVTPAATALVRLTPVTMHSVNRKLPKKDSRNSSQRVCADSGASPGTGRSQPSMATAPMPKRSQASSSTGNRATSGLDRAT